MNRWVNGQRRQGTQHTESKTRGECNDATCTIGDDNKPNAQGCAAQEGLSDQIQNSHVLLLIPDQDHSDVVGRSVPCSIITP